MNESDWIRLTPKLVRGEPPDTIAEYGKPALSPYSHLLRNVRQGGPMRVRDDGALEFSSAELAAIPIVGVIVEAHLRLLDICMFLTPSLIYQYLGDDAAVAAGLPLWPERYSGDPSMRLDLSWAEAAAAPFKESADG